MNVVGNSIKFSSHGVVQLRVECEAQLNKNGRTKLRFEVEDNGIGISGAQRERLFLPFTQLDGSATRRFGGAGLGLVLSRRLAQALGGDLVLEWSSPGGGSCFAIEAEVATWRARDRNGP